MTIKNKPPRPSCFHRLSIRVLSLVLFLAVAQTQVFAAYNQGTYGSGAYSGSGTSSATPTPTAASSNSNSSSGSTLGASDSKPLTCSDQPPGSAPDLFQIDRIGRSARLYLAPAVQPYNKYIIAYGMDDRTEQFGVQFDGGYTTGVIDYAINELDPDTAYSFKVQAGNGCATGAWSNVLKAGAIRSAMQSFYRVGGSSGGNIGMGSSPSSFTDTVVFGSPATSPSPAVKVTEVPKYDTQPAQTKPMSQTPTQQNQGGFWQWILNLFR